jgi:GT2 family glycosyltransferase
MPDVTVVIPTRDRWDVLARTVAALREQELGDVEAEVVVVDNGSRTPAPELEGARVVVEPVPGAAAARNRGVAEAGGEFVLFIGDDCVPADRGLVRGHAELQRRAPGAITGRIEWDPAVERTPVMDWLERSGHMVDMERLRREQPGPETFYTGNVSVPRRALLEVAGFDQRFSGYGFEDLELALRLADRGVRFAHAPELGVLHSHHYTLERSLARMEAVGRGGRLLHTIHDHRRPLPGPPAGRRRLALGLLFDRLPPLPGDLGLRAAHLAAFTRGYRAAPLDDSPALRGYGSVPRFSDQARPPVSVIVPFLGSRAEGEALLRALARLRLGEGDELIVADNGGALPEREGSPRVLHALDERSSYYARNVGADAARNDWLLFLDADTLPPASLLDDYFREPVDERCGALAGGVVAARDQRALVARYAASRRYLSQAAHMRDVHRPYAITANLLVRRAAWAEVGGFFEGLRSGGDQDLCWRIQDAGWTLAYREPAAVEHRHRERVGPLARQMARYSAAIAWMERRAPGSSPRPRVARRLARSVAGSLVWLAGGRHERAAFKALDGVVVAAEGAGYLLSNDATRRTAAGEGGGVRALLVSEWPTREAGARARALGGPLLIEAARRPERPDRAAAGDFRARYAEDDGILRRTKSKASSISTLSTSGAKTHVPGDVAAVARRLKKAGVTEVHCDPESRERASLIAAVLGLEEPRTVEAEQRQALRA